MPKPRKNVPRLPRTSPGTKTAKKGKPARKDRLGTPEDTGFDPVAQLRAAYSHPGPKAGDGQHNGRAAVLDRLWDIIESSKGGNAEASHSARLIERGTARVVQKFGEEAVECLIEALAGHRPELIAESADVLYHLLVIWVDAGIRPEEVWKELEKREGVSRLAGETNVPLKRLLGSANIRTTKIP